jgi:hypothetical protein
MNSQNNQNLEQRLQELEAELQPGPSAPFSVQQGQPLQPLEDAQPALPLYSQLLNWFRGLSGTGQAIAVCVAVVVGLALFKIAVQVVTLLISLAFLGVLLYGGYKLFLTQASK